MKFKKIVPIVFSIIIVIVDEILQYLALKNLPDESLVNGKKFLTLAIHKNFGMAFDIPVWLPLIIFITIVTVVWLIFWGFKEWPKKPRQSTAVIIIALGAIGNLLDRIIYGFTVDYIIIPATTSAFNLSDIVIITGLILLIWNSYKVKKN